MGKNVCFEAHNGEKKNLHGILCVLGKQKKKLLTHNMNRMEFRSIKNETVFFFKVQFYCCVSLKMSQYMQIYENIILILYQFRTSHPTIENCGRELMHKSVWMSISFALSYVSVATRYKSLE